MRCFSLRAPVAVAVNVSVRDGSLGQVFGAHAYRASRELSTMHLWRTMLILAYNNAWSEVFEYKVERFFAAQVNC